jgi:hypothetical protein
VTGDEVAHIIGAITALFWVLIAAFVVWLLRRPLTATVSRMATFEAFGVKFALCVPKNISLSLSPRKCNA